MTPLEEEVCKERQRIVLRDAGGEMSVLEFCNEHIKRGWAYDSLSPEELGFEPDDIIRLTNPYQLSH